MKKWVIAPPDPAAVKALSASGLSPLCCQVLVSQGIVSMDQAVSRMGSTSLSDPFAIIDMMPAADALNAAIDAGERICVYGDYDCDGVMATVILYSYLSSMGADVTWRIPERSEGYGLNEQAVREMHADGVQMIVTVDNGISAVPEAALIRELGMSLVITDHHQPGPTLPEAAAVVDAHRQDNTSTFRLYCGAGIALLLVAAMSGGDLEMALEQFGDLAAIATVADVVPLIGENRYLVQIGLDYLENTERPGLIALRERAGLKDKTLTAQNISFGISPRINAAGRLRSPRLAVELLLEEDPSRAAALAAEIDEINAARKSCEAEIVKNVLASVVNDPDRLHDRVLIFAGEDWHMGVIGIVAARLQERYGRPCFMVSLHDGIGHGSARSFGDFSVFDCLTACEDLFEKFGGHPAAGGFTIKEENLDAFRQRVAAYAAEHHPTMPVMETRVACTLKKESLTVEAVESLSQLEPFGADNPEPVFLAENAQILDIRSFGQGIHTRLTVRVDGQDYAAKVFRVAPADLGIRANEVVHLLVRPEVNRWNGNENVELVVQDYRPAGLQQTKILAALAAYDQWRRGEALPKAWYPAILPSREDLTHVYKCLPTEGIRIDRLANAMFRAGMNHCKLRLCLDVFCELGLAASTDGEVTVHRVVPAARADLGSSQILARLSALAKE